MKIENFYTGSATELTTDMKQNSTTAEKKLKNIENKIADIITSLSTLKGRTNKHARITALLYIYKKATQKQLREITNYSLGTISNTLQSLEQIGIIHKTRDSQTREYTYELEGSIITPGSKSLTNIYEYFSQQKQFLKKIKTKLHNPKLSNKKGYSDVTEFVNKMEKAFPSMENALQNTLNQLRNQKEEEMQ
jgi:DNA-binding transcriptional regulator GbsR (MarR family)